MSLSIRKPQFTTTPDGRIDWCDDWVALTDAIHSGALPVRVVSGGPGTYGHTDFYVIGSEQEAPR